MDADRLLKLVRARRSVRRFSSEPVSLDAEQRLLEAAIWAPTAGNAQPWCFVCVRSSEHKAQLCRAALQQRFIADAPLVVVVCADLDRAVRAYGERGASLYCLQDTAAATQNLLLAAHAMGLGSCWVGAFQETEVARVLGLEAHLRPVAVVAVGEPAEQPKAPARREVSAVAIRIG
ncbi:MAG: nitroreductase family protein [Deltaproteobacteria bacterium]|nr:nitroreductase family protein [Deltaproteobacteria bacterium]MBW2537154.1 nitroreductase family protein [Deltaproteobacteria bacterium]